MCSFSSRRCYITRKFEQSSGLSGNLATIGEKKNIRIEKKDASKTMTDLQDELIETKKLIECILKEKDQAQERQEDGRKIKRRARDTASELMQTETQKQINDINESFQIRKAAFQKKLMPKS